MTKTVSTALLISSVVLASSVFADNNASSPQGLFGTLGYQYTSTGDDIQDNGYFIGLGYGINKFMSVDVTTYQTTTTVSEDREILSFNGDNMTNKFELGLTSFYGAQDNLGVYNRIVLGRDWGSFGSDSVTYGAFEVGGYFKPYGEMSPTMVSGGFKTSDLLSSNDYSDTQTEAMVLSGEYEIMSGHSVVASYEYDLSDHDLDVSQFSLAYKVRF